MAGTGAVLRAAGVRSRAPTPLAPRFLTALAALALVVCLPLVSAAQTPAGTAIDNQATATYDLGAALGLTAQSNLHTTIVAPLRTPATAELLQHAPAAAGAQNVIVPASRCSSTGLVAGPFNPVPPPVQLDGTPIALPGPVDLLGAAQYTLGAPVFLRLSDADQNLDSALAETVLVQISSAAGDSELVELTETGVASGVFTGHIQTAEAAVTANDCVLQGLAGGSLALSYTDPADPGDVAGDTAELSPLSRVFDSSNGGLLDGVTVALVDDASGLPAAVFGDDGVSAFPSTVTTGGTFTDGVKIYVFPAGTYRFPYVPAGTYRIVVTPPSGYLAPSAATDPALQALPGAPYALSGASRGLAFTLATAAAIDVDLPLDPTALLPFLVKTASQSAVAIGDFLQYNLQVANPGIGAAPAGILLTDRLPLGFRYQTGSSRLNDVAIADPLISADGRTLTYTLPVTPAPAVQNLRYVLEVTSGTPLGDATNVAQADVIGGGQSFQASATVIVREELFASSTLLMGRVAVGACESAIGPDTPGLDGVRVYLEDGTYSVSDENGFFHFEGLQPGVHVVQLDMDSLPVQYEPVPCTSNTRFAGRAFSQFADIQGGTLWRTDFRVALRAPEQGYVNSQIRTRLVQGRALFEVELRGNGVPVRDVRIISLLPEGVVYQPGTSRLDGEPLADPEITENVVTHRLDDPSGRWARVLSFEGAVESAEPDLRLHAQSFAMFRTPTARAVRTPVAQAVLLQDSRSASDVQIVETEGLLPGSEWSEDVVPTPEPEAEPIEPEHDLAWLERAAPGLEWISPMPGFAPEIPSLKIAVKHDQAHEISLLRNGEPVSNLNLAGQLRGQNGSALTSWSGVDLVEGANHFEVIARAADGSPAGRLEYQIHYSGAPVRAELVPEDSRLSADGRSNPVIALRLRDRWGMPARKGVVGEFSVNRPYEAARSRDSREARRILGLDLANPTYTVEEDGIARIQLEPTSATGKVEVALHLQDRHEELVIAWLEPEERDWVLVGLAEGTLAYRNLSGNMATLDALDIDEHGDLARRMSLFAKGRIKGKWLLTLAYDSQTERDDDHQGLETIIDANRYYTMYGSTAEQKEEAPSREKLYVKLERRQFYALFGDYDTSLDVTEFARYDRNFTGFKTEYEGDRFSFSGFASDTQQGFIRDEIRGEGISGLYRLSRNDLEPGSEKVRLETRDRFKTEVVLESREQVRYSDYNIDYQAGTLYFNTPIPSKDQQFNPVFIVVEYESEDDKDESIIAGGRGAVHFMDDRLELGASVIHEGTTGQDGELLGGDLRFDIDDQSSFHAEYAGTDHKSLTGPRQGAAWLAELETSRERLSGRAYLREQDAEFGLGQQSQTEQGTRKMGLESRFQVSDAFALTGEAYRQENLQTGAERDVLDTRADYQWSDASVYGGYRMARDSGGGNPDALSHQLLAGGAWSTLGDRLRLRLGTELALAGDDENPDFPTRLLFGADYELTPEVTLFAEQELTFGDKEDTRGSRIGFRAKPWQGAALSTSYEQRGGAGGPTSFANLGLAQTWQVNDRWSFEAAFDSSHTLRDPGNTQLNTNVPPASGTVNDDFSAISLGSTYKLERFAWTGRVETRSGDLEDKWGFFTGFVREVNDGVGYSLSLEYFDTNSSAGADQRDTDLRLGTVWRRPNSRWIVLNRLDLSAEDRDGPTFGFDVRKVVNNINVNYQWTPRLQISMQYGAKYVSDTIDGESYDGYIDIWGLELRRDLSDRWDLGLSARLRSSWKADVVQSSWGAELGYQLRKNIWVSAGYNFGGFRDDDFSGADYTSAGPYVKFRYKFDQQTIRELLDWERYRRRRVKP